MIDLDRINIVDDNDQILIDIRGTNAIIPKKKETMSWTFEYNYETKKWEEVDE